MDRDILTHMPVVLCVARRNSFAAAAKELGMSPSAVSHAVKATEERLGIPLFARTTRSVSLTEVGATFIATARPALAELAGAVEQARQATGKISGLLRLNVPKFAVTMIVGPLVSRMTERYPDLSIEVFTESQKTDIVAAGFDAGVRIGDQIAQDMIAVQLAPPFRSIIVGAPDYLARRGTPKAPRDLLKHDCITFRVRAEGRPYAWEVMEEGVEIELDVNGPVLVNDAEYMVDLAVEGKGLVYMFEPLLADHLRTGRLVEILPRASTVEEGIYLYYPQRAARLPKLRAFIDLAREMPSPW